MKKIFFSLPVLLGIYVPAMATDSLEFCIYNDGAYVISNFFIDNQGNEITSISLGQTKCKTADYDQTNAGPEIKIIDSSQPSGYFSEGCSWDNDWYGQYTKVTWKASGNVADHSSITCHTKSKK